MNSLRLILLLSALVLSLGSDCGSSNTPDESNQQTVPRENQTSNQTENPEVVFKLFLQASHWRNVYEGAESEANAIRLQVALAEESGQSELMNPSITNSVGMEMIEIPAGKFEMGAKEGQGQNWERPQHTISITKPFLISAHETTVEQFARFVNESDYKTEGEDKFEGGWGYKNGDRDMRPEHNWKTPGFQDEDYRQSDDHPVTQVTWNDAVAFCKWLSKKEGKVYRLPTEAEWEYACRAGSTTSFNFGDQIDADHANFEGASMKHTVKVGSYEKNKFGLYDMHGNVTEWCQDWFGRDYYQSTPKEDPQGPNEGPFYVIRGGAWNSPGEECHSFSRRYGTPGPFNHYGFRVVCEVESIPGK